MLFWLSTDDYTPTILVLPGLGFLKLAFLVIGAGVRRNEWWASIQSGLRARQIRLCLWHGSHPVTSRLPDECVWLEGFNDDSWRITWSSYSTYYVDWAKCKTSVSKFDTWWRWRWQCKRNRRIQLQRAWWRAKPRNPSTEQHYWSEFGAEPMHLRMAKALWNLKWFSFWPRSLADSALSFKRSFCDGEHRMACFSGTSRDRAKHNRGHLV